MTKQSQKDFVISQLNQTNEISRNLCLKNYITRLGAIVFQLKEDGYEFKTVWRENLKPDGTKGKDFVYKVTRHPGQLSDDTLSLF